MAVAGCAHTPAASPSYAELAKASPKHVKSRSSQYERSGAYVMQATSAGSFESATQSILSGLANSLGGNSQQAASAQGAGESQSDRQSLHS